MSNTGPGRRKILLVDDSSTMLLVVQSILSREPYDVITARDGEEAIRKATLERPDLIVMDVIMPKMTGIIACKQLKQRIDTKDIPIILLTTRSEADMVESGYESGCNDYIIKPVNGTELISKIRNQLARSRRAVGQAAMKPAPFLRELSASARRYLREVLLENRQLRAQIAILERDKQRVAELARLAELARAEAGAVAERLARAEDDRRRFSARSVSLEERSADLASMFAASHRLHATLDRVEVLAGIQDILGNLIGCEQFAVFEAKAKGYHLVLSVGIDERGTGPIGAALEQSGTVLTAADPRITAVVPLAIDGTRVGAIVILQLLPQKAQGLEPLDHELLQLLGTHAAAALRLTAMNSDGR